MAQPQLKRAVRDWPFKVKPLHTVLGCEITGITWSPDYRAMWINVQHPELSFPASDGQSRPRSSTVLITRDDGGVIGT